MSANEQLIHTFYTSFQNKDYAGMQNCYSEDAIFNDEVFKNLNAQQAKKMWEMLIKRAYDLELRFNNVQADDQKGSAEWMATYTFSKTGRKVVNYIHASFVFKNGKIQRHRDQFNFRKWAKQAIGPVAGIPVFIYFLKKRVQKTAMKNLEEYMAK